VRGDAPLGAEIHGRRVLHDGHVSLVEIDVTLPPPGGGRKRYVVATSGPAVGVLPLLEDGSVMLVRQYRPAVEAAVSEIPAGGVDDGESAEAAARRELEEETGLVPARLEPLGAFVSSPGICSERLELFVAHGCRATGERSGERVELERAPSLAELVARVESGSLPDGKTQAAVLRVALRNTG
jgi:ADP-ribose pyrophosphatase